MIQVEGLTKTYGVVHAIVDVTFRVETGRILGFLGPNGAGKTTTMRILTGNIPATSGTATLSGFDVFTQSLEVRRRLGYLPERVPIYRDMRVRDYLKFVAAVKGVPARERDAHVDETLRLTDIADVRHRIVGNLSRGYQQRVGIAQAIVGDPEILILDEPQSGLDPKQLVEIRQLIRSFKGQRTIILSTHILPEVSEVCDDVVIINKGRVVVQQRLDQLTASAHRLNQLLLQVKGPAGDIEAAVRNVTGVREVNRLAADGDEAPRWEVQVADGQDVRGALAKAVVDAGWDLLELHPVRESLEDVFLQTITQQAPPLEVAA